MFKYRNILVILVLLTIFVQKGYSMNCMERAQEFKCTYTMLKCTDGDNGKCECEDKTICEWEDGIGNENCPCGAKKASTGPRRKRRRIHSDM